MRIIENPEHFKLECWRFICFSNVVTVKYLIRQFILKFFVQNSTLYCYWFIWAVDQVVCDILRWLPSLTLNSKTSILRWKFWASIFQVHFVFKQNQIHLQFLKWDYKFSLIGIPSSCIFDGIRPTIHYEIVFQNIILNCIWFIFIIYQTQTRDL